MSPYLFELVCYQARQDISRDLEFVGGRLYLRSVWSLPSCAPWASAIAPARRRGPGPRPATSFEYNLRRVPPTNSNPSLARDNFCINQLLIETLWSLANRNNIQNALASYTASRFQEPLQCLKLKGRRYYELLRQKKCMIVVTNINVIEKWSSNSHQLTYPSLK